MCLGIIFYLNGPPHLLIWHQRAVHKRKKSYIVLSTTTYFVLNCNVLALVSFYALPSGGNQKTRWSIVLMCMFALLCICSSLCVSVNHLSNHILDPPFYSSTPYCWSNVYLSHGIKIFLLFGGKSVKVFC